LSRQYAKKKEHFISAQNLLDIILWRIVLSEILEGKRQKEECFKFKNPLQSLLDFTMGILFNLRISRAILIGGFGRTKKYFCSLLYLNQYIFVFK